MAHHPASHRQRASHRQPESQEARDETAGRSRGGEGETEAAEAAAPEPTYRGARALHPVTRAIEQSVALPAGTTGAGALAAVMCALARAQRPSDARALAESFPAELQGLVEPCAVHADLDRRPLTRHQLVESVAAHLRIDAARAEPLIRSIFGAVEHAVPRRELATTLAELPAELVELWPNAEQILQAR